MSRFFPRTEYAEDQPMSHTILATHVLHRALQTGAFAGLSTGVGTHVYRLSKTGIRFRPVVKPGHFLLELRGAVNPTLSHTVFSHAGTGAMLGLAIMGVALPVMMSGKQEIEWQDRSWRLLNNQGQLEVDNWSLGGAVVGVVASATNTKHVSLRQVIGKSALGSLAGVLGYMAYRYGMMGGRGTLESKGRAEIPESVRLQFQ